MKTNLNRWQAFAIHMGISLVIFIILFLLIILIWYPGIFIELGGWRGIKIVAGVDIVLGPLLTLIIFNPRKKELTRDLTIIGLIQFSCLSIGTWIVYQERPMIQLIADGELYVMTRSELIHKEVPLDELEAFPGKYPKKAYSDLPSDPQKLIPFVVTSDIVIQYRSDLYRPLLINEKSVFEWQFKGLEWDQEKECIWTPIQSPHTTGQACFHLARGIIELKQ